MTIAFVIRSPKYGVFDVLLDDDQEHLLQYRWYISKAGGDRFYVGSHYTPSQMHAMIINPPPGFETDHIHHYPGQNFIDNRRENLRAATKSQNAMNSHKRQGASSRYKGVSWIKHAKKYMAYITVNKKTKYLGLYVSPLAAAAVYNGAARVYYGQRAKLNFLGLQPEN